MIEKIKTIIQKRWIKQQITPPEPSERERELMTRVRRLEKALMEKKPEPLLELGDYKNAFELASDICENKYGIKITEMIQKLAWWYIMTTGGIPQSSYWFDRGLRVTKVLNNAFKDVDRLMGIEKPFDDLNEVKQTIQTAAELKKSLKEIVSEEEKFGLKDIGDIVESFMNVRSMLAQPQTPPPNIDFQTFNKPRSEVKKEIEFVKGDTGMGSGGEEKTEATATTPARETTRNTETSQTSTET